MGKLSIYELIDGPGVELAERGHHVVYRSAETNRCPGCGRANWYVGRTTAECGFCGTAVVLAEAQLSSAPAPSRTVTGTPWSERRTGRRVSASGAQLKAKVAGSPQTFALEDVSSTGARARSRRKMTPNMELLVKLASGREFRAKVVWVDGERFGLAFTGDAVSSD